MWMQKDANAHFKQNLNCVMSSASLPFAPPSIMPSFNNYFIMLGMYVCMTDCFSLGAPIYFQS